ncbi:MAG: PepSY-like domain-containing protein [Ferruginibacter sp.]
MKKYFLLMVTMLAISLSGFAINVPKAVSDAFAKKFPGVSNIKWTKENAKEYEAEFILNGRSASANFLADGSWVETEAGINSTDLPAAVLAAVAAKHPGAKIFKAYKIETAKGVLTYEAEIKTGNKKQEMVLTADGTVIK